MRRRQLKWLWARLAELSKMQLTREELLMRLGAARAKARAGWRLVTVEVAEAEAVKTKAAKTKAAKTKAAKTKAAKTKAAKSEAAKAAASFTYALDRKKLRQVRRREGRYLLRTNMSDRDPADLWKFYIQLTEVEAAFKNLKDDLSLRPIFHQLEHRIEAHIFVAFLAYCLHVTLRARLRPLAPGLTPRAVLDKLGAMQMLDVHFPTVDGRTLILTRHTEPTADHKILLQQLGLTLPPQPPPRIAAQPQPACQTEPAV